MPDAQYGERPMAFVTSKNPALKGADVITWAKKDSQISGFMVCPSLLCCWGCALILG